MSAAVNRIGLDRACESFQLECETALEVQAVCEVVVFPRPIRRVSLDLEGVLARVVEPQR